MPHGLYRPVCILQVDKSKLTYLIYSHGYMDKSFIKGYQLSLILFCTSFVLWVKRCSTRYINIFEVVIMVEMFVIINAFVHVPEK